MAFSLLSPAVHVALAQEGYNNGRTAVLTIPSNAIPGSNAERQEAYNSLSEPEKEDAHKIMQGIIDNVIKQRLPISQPIETTLTFRNEEGS